MFWTKREMKSTTINKIKNKRILTKNKAIILCILLLISVVGCASKDKETRSLYWSEKFSEAKNYYEQKKYDKAIEIILDSIDEADINSDNIEAFDVNKKNLIYLYYISYCRDNFFKGNNAEAVRYINKLHAIEGVLTEEEITSIKKDLPELIANSVDLNAYEKEVESYYQRIKRKNEGVKIGMTQEEVLMSSWGEPIDINKTTTKYGVSEQWVYEDDKYLYFEDGILTAIQE